MHLNSLRKHRYCLERKEQKHDGLISRNEKIVGCHGRLAEIEHRTVPLPLPFSSPPTPPLNPLTDPTVCAPRTIPYPTLLPFHKQHIFLEKKPQLLCGFPRINPTRQGLRAPSKVKLRRQRQLLHRMRRANNAFRLKTSELTTFLHVFVNQVSTYRSFFCRISP